MEIQKLFHLPNIYRLNCTSVLCIHFLLWHMILSSFPTTRDSSDLNYFNISTASSLLQQKKSIYQTVQSPATRRFNKNLEKWPHHTCFNLQYVLYIYISIYREPKTRGGRAFAVRVLGQWNKLPEKIRSVESVTSFKYLPLLFKSLSWSYTMLLIHLYFSV